MSCLACKYNALCCPDFDLPCVTAADSTEAVLVALENPAQMLDREAIVLLSAQHLDTFLLQVIGNTTLQQLVNGVLVDPIGTHRCIQSSHDLAAFPLYPLPAAHSHPIFFDSRHGAKTPAHNRFAMHQFTLLVHSVLLVCPWLQRSVEF